MIKILSKLKMSAIVAAIFYTPLIKLYNYLENNDIEFIDIEETKQR